MAHDIHDDGFHEVQLSGKQVVFLVMATTVVSIVIFLCGVLVGRGTPLGDVTDVTAEALQGAESLDPNLDETPAAPQSNTPTAVEGLSYPERLQGGAASAEPVAPPAAPAKAPPGPQEPEAPSSKSASKADEARPTPQPTPAPPAQAPTPAPAVAAPAAAAPSAGGGFTVQVTALKNKADADAIASRLQGRGYRAYVVAPEGSGPVIYKVRVGMNMQRPEAEQIMGRLKSEEKFQPWITR